MSHDHRKLNTFPVFLRIENRTLTIVGNGEEALAKSRLLVQTSASIKIIADSPSRDLDAFAARNGLELVTDPYEKRSLRGSALVFAATGFRNDDRRIVSDARSLGIPVNAVDRPDLCDFLTPALVNRAPVAIAIGSEGACPVLVQSIRRRIDAMLSPSLGRLARLAAGYRDAAERILKPGASRRAFWRSFFDGRIARDVAEGNVERAARRGDKLLENGSHVAGHVALVGAGPGAEDLLTLKAQRLLYEADVVVHDALVPETVIAMGRRDAQRIAAGKRKGCHSKRQQEINELLVSLARAGKRVVRLKSGDPLVFGRAGEEMAALRDARVSYEIVPGVTSAFAAAADFELPLTLRGVASSMVFTTGHDLKGKALPDWAKLAISGATVAVYMGRTNAADVAARLIDAGLAADTAVAVVENASLDERRRFHGTLADLPSLQHRHQPGGPVMTIIGDAVAGASFENSTPLAAIFNKTQVKTESA